VTVLAIDPGPTESAYCVINPDTGYPLAFSKIPNEHLLSWLKVSTSKRYVIEWVSSYGMPVGAEVFETCLWVGRFVEGIKRDLGVEVELVKRLPVRMWHCHSVKATDTTVRQALVDRFAYGQPNHGKGSKKEPGWFHGFAADTWQAYALAVYVADQGRVAADTPGSGGQDANV
jgi:hypothetical protein